MIGKKGLRSNLLKFYFNHSLVYDDSDNTISEFLVMTFISNMPIGDSICDHRFFLFLNLLLVFEWLFRWLIAEEPGGFSFVVTFRSIVGLEARLSPRWVVAEIACVPWNN